VILEFRVGTGGENFLKKESENVLRKNGVMDVGGNQAGCTRRSIGREGEPSRRRAWSGRSRRGGGGGGVQLDDHELNPKSGETLLEGKGGQVYGHQREDKSGIVPREGGTVNKQSILSRL